MDDTKEKCRKSLLGPIIRIGAFCVAATAIWVVLASNYIRTGPAPKNTCINNLRQLDGAVQQWALEHHKANLFDPRSRPQINPPKSD
jgi:hypothetical protein